MLIETSGRMNVKQYWDFNFNDDLKISEAEAIEEIERLFKQAVQRQLIMMFLSTLI